MVRITVVALALAACTPPPANCPPPPPPPPAPSAAPCEQPKVVASAAPADKTVAVGALVVLGSQGSTNFTEGKVTAIDGDKVTIEYGQPDKESGKRSTRTEERSHAWFAGVDPAALKPGEAVACRDSDGGYYFSACLVKSVEGPVVTVEDGWGRSKNLAAGAIMRPDPVTQKDLKDSIAQEKAGREWEAARDAAGKPARPANWKPKAGEKILILWASTWRPGSVKKVAGATITVHYDGTSWKDEDMTADKIVPVSAKGSGKVKVGQYVIAEPSFADSSWDAYKVEAVDGDIADVSDRSGERHKVNVKSLIPFE